jgi:hypothetical protein
MSAVSKEVEVARFLAHMLDEIVRARKATEQAYQFSANSYTYYALSALVRLERKLRGVA